MNTKKYNIFPLNSLIKQAKKFNDFKEFSKFYALDIYHGYYWHITNNKDFKISDKTGPRDMSSMSDGRISEHGAIMLTSHLEYWDEHYNIDKDTEERKNKRPYAVLFDSSDIEPKYLRQVGRGFGNEVYLNSNEAKNLKQIGVYSIEEAQRMDEKFHNILPQSEEVLKQLYVYAKNKKQNENAFNIKKIIKETVSIILLEGEEIEYKGFKFWEEYLDYHHGQNDIHIDMYKDDQPVAYADYSKFQGKIYIKYIESLVRGKGYGHILMEYLASKYGYENLERGSLTPDGVKMRQKLDKQFNFDYEEYNNHHFKEEVLNQIKNPLIVEFLKLLNKFGYEKGWEIWINSGNSKKNVGYDWNEIDDISKWIRGSATNNHSTEDEPDGYVVELLNQLTGKQQSLSENNSGVDLYKSLNRFFSELEIYQSNHFGNYDRNRLKTAYAQLPDKIKQSLIPKNTSGLYRGADGLANKTAISFSNLNTASFFGRYVIPFKLLQSYSGLISTTKVYRINQKLKLNFDIGDDEGEVIVFDPEWKQGINLEKYKIE